MRSGAAAGHSGYFHELGFFGSDDELVGLVVPLLTGGADAGEPTIVAIDDRAAAVVREAAGDLVGVTYLPVASQYDRPAVTIRRYREVLEHHVAAGAAQVRAVGTVPHPGLGEAWDRWARYEAAVHRALADLPLWGLCIYDTRTAPEDVCRDVHRMHPYIATPDGGHVVNRAFVAPDVVVAGRPPPPPDPVEAEPPAAVVVEPTPAAARRAVRDVARHSSLDRPSIDDLLIAVSEAVANAVVYGEPPIVLRAWARPDRVVVNVTDCGPGPSDPLVGLMPVPVPDQSRGGLGLWIAHQVCSEVALRNDHGGFTLRLTMRVPTGQRTA